MTEQTFKLWKTRLKQKKWTKQEIGALTKLFGSQRFGSTSKDRHSMIDHVKRNFTTSDDYSYDHAADILYCKEYQITKDQSQFGIEWLKRYCFKANMNTFRKPALDNFKGDMHDVAHIVKTFSKFRFVGLLGHQNRMGEAVQFTPIYRTYSRDGSYFEYSPLHWGKPCLMTIKRVS